MLLLPLLLFSLLQSSSPAAAADPATSAYDALRAHGLPIGLFPQGLRDFRVDDSSGRFEVRLDRACNAKFENEVHYDANVTGTISYGQIGALSGISAKELFLWFPVKGIRVDVPSSGLIYFDVGVIYKQFSLSLFETPPECKAAADVAPNLLEGRNFARVVSQSMSGKLRYELDQGDVGKGIL